MKVTVLIPTRNRASLVGEAIRSVQAQTLPPHEIIVIDNGSDDDTPAVLAGFGAALQVIHQPQVGKSRSLNAGIARATGDAIIVLDDDDLFPPHALEAHVNALRRTPEADFSYGRFIRFSGEAPTVLPVDHPDVELVPLDGRRTVIKLMERCFLPNPTWMVRREAFERVGLYDVEALRSQDYDMILRLADQNDGVFVDEVVLLQRQHGGVRPGVRALTGGGDDPFAAWAAYNRRIFDRIFDSWTLEQFRPFPVFSERAAWFQKGVTLFIRRLYPESFEAFDKYLALLGEDTPSEMEGVAAFHLLVEEISPGLLADSDESHSVRRSMRNRRWPREIRRAFVKGGRWHVRSAIKEGDYLGAYAAMKFLTEAFGTVGVAAGFTARREPDRISRDVQMVPAKAYARDSG